MSTRLPDIALLEGVVSDQILDAMERASARLTELGIGHALVGALAVGAYGYPRASKDVDFLVSDSAFVAHEAGIVSIAPGVPVLVGSVIIDNIGVPIEHGHLREAISRAVPSRGIPVAPIEAVAYMKLLSPRTKDAGDVVELLKAGVDERVIREYLDAHNPVLIEKFDSLVREAAEER